MFYALSKIIGLLLNPLLWVLGILTYGILTKNKKKARYLLWISLLSCFLFSNAFVVSEFTRMWEVPLQAEPDSLHPYDVGIVLGGGMVQSDKSLNRLIFRKNTDRIFQAVELYKEKKIKKILIAGGKEYSLNIGWSEAPLVREYLLKIGIPDTDILVDSLSKNTHENAVNSATLIKKQAPTATLLLITSSLHMRRAMGCFAKAGLKCTPYTTNPLSGPRHYELSHILVPHASSLVSFEELIHETLGNMAYRIAGYL